MPIGWTCKKQTAVARSITEAEHISLDAGLRLEGLDLWDLVLDVLHSKALRNPLQDIPALRNPSPGQMQPKNHKSRQSG